MFTFICEHEYDNDRIEYTTEAVTLCDLSEAFLHFLRGCGFQVDEVECIVEDDEPCCCEEVDTEELELETAPDGVQTADYAISASYSQSPRQAGYCAGKPYGG